MRNVFLSYQIFDFIAIFCPFYPTPQKIVAQKPKTISSKEETTLPGYPHLHLSLSIGAVLQGSADPLEEAVHRADSLLYQAKAKKNAIVLEADPLTLRERNLRQQRKRQILIVEFRNGESGLHVQHIRALTEKILDHLLEKTSDYKISAEEQDNIPLASALHDIGKITIDETILNKPGRLTKEEFEVIKTHCMQGANMLRRLENFEDEPLLQTAYDIARWHHERWDGRGYPDGLKGNDIPLSAQIVSLADVYDALTSERCYKEAFSHETAMRMILNGECGAFNPLLLECLTDIQAELQKKL